MTDPGRIIELALPNLVKQEKVKQYPSPSFNEKWTGEDFGLEGVPILTKKFYDFFLPKNHFFV